MLTKDDVSQIGQVIDEKIVLRLEDNNKVLRQELATKADLKNLATAAAVKEGFDGVDKQFEGVTARLNKVEHKLDRAFDDSLERHDRWIKQLAAKVGVELARE